MQGKRVPALLLGAWWHNAAELISFPCYPQNKNPGIWCGQENSDLDPGKSTSLDAARDRSWLMPWSVGLDHILAEYRDRIFLRWYLWTACMKKKMHKIIVSIIIIIFLYCQQLLLLLLASDSIATWAYFFNRRGWDFFPKNFMFWVSLFMNRGNIINIHSEQKNSFYCIHIHWMSHSIPYVAHHIEHSFPWTVCSQ